VLGQVLSTGEYKVLLVREYQDMLYEEPEQTYHVMTLDGGDASLMVKPCPPFRVGVTSQARAVVKGVAYFLLYVIHCDILAQGLIGLIRTLIPISCNFFSGSL
jgi:hypothetical protein